MVTERAMRWPRVEAARGALLITLAVFILGGAFASRMGHGLAATWRASEQVVARTFETRPFFGSYLRPEGRYVEHWRFLRDGIPDALPPLDVELEGILHAPVEVFVRTESPDEVDLLVDGRSADGPVAAGDHELKIRWRHGERSDAWEGTQLSLRWHTPMNGWEPVPTTALSPLDGISTWAWLFWMFALVVALGSGVGTFWYMRATDGAQRFRRRMVCLTTLVVLLGAGLRFYDVESVPLSRENDDELFAIWNGYSLLTEGVSRGWSAWPGRTPSASVETLPYFGRTFQVVSPYLEHPPLQHLIVGGAAALGGATQYSHSRVSHGRIAAVVESLVTLVLIVLIGLRLAPRSHLGLIAATIYAVLPTTVIFNRVIKEEGLMTLLMLLSIWLFQRWRESKRKRELLLGAIAAGLCTFVKLPGIAVAVAFTVLVASEGKLRPALVAAILGLSGVVLVVSYAYVIDWDTFALATEAQSGARPTRFDEFLGFFTESRINHNRIGRPWLIFLWLTFAAETLRRNEHILTVPLVLYMGAIGLASGTYFMGWYSLPLYPFLCLGCGRYLIRLGREPALFPGALFVLLPLMYSLTFFLEPSGDVATFPHPVSAVVGVALGLLVPFGIAQTFSGRWARSIGRFGMAFVCSLFVASNVHFITNYDVFYALYYRMDIAAVR